MTSDLLKNILHHATGNPPEAVSIRSIGGGCINHCHQLSTADSTYFVKSNAGEYLEMFLAEYDGLQALKKRCQLRIPEPIKYGQLEDHSYLVMEFIETRARSQNYWEILATGLAKLHLESSVGFGWEVSNYIGRLPQSNKRHQSWIDFFIQERLYPQIKLAEKSALLSARNQADFELLFSKMDQLLVIEPPSFLHGDLWSGNIMTDARGEPCLVDPAVYYGHREVEIAFTTLFGGFDRLFYQAYHEAFPLAPGYQQRFEVYNLYPLLVHLNLFGRGYLAQITQILRQYV